VLQAWLAERDGRPEQPVFPTNRGRPLSRDAVGWLLAKHAATAQHDCPSIGGKTITPHVLRHTAAMRLLHAGVDTSVIAPGSATRRPTPFRSTYTPTSP
jgi:site-specific recombinase XerD